MRRLVSIFMFLLPFSLFGVEARLAWSFDTGISNPTLVAASTMDTILQRCFGEDGSVAIAVYSGGGPGSVFWVTGSGENAELGSTTNTTVLEVSNQFALVAKGPRVLSFLTPSNMSEVTIYYRSNNVLRSTSLGSFRNVQAVDSQRYKTPASSLKSRFFSIDPTTRVLSCYSVDSDTVTQGGPNSSLSIQRATSDRVSVTANSSSASELSLQISTNLNQWSDLITITQPRPSESLIIPIGDRTNLYLRISAY